MESGTEPRLLVGVSIWRRSDAARIVRIRTCQTMHPIWTHLLSLSLSPSLVDGSITGSVQPSTQTQTHTLLLLPTLMKLFANTIAVVVVTVFALVFAAGMHATEAAPCTSVTKDDAVAKPQ